MVVGGALCLLILLVGARAFQQFEQWTFLDSFYFAFITMSTIGFGDYVALQNDTMAALQTEPAYVIFCVVYILLGLTVFAAALNQMVLRLLTLNTEDERKDELQAMEESRRAAQLNGDVITANEHMTVACTEQEFLTSAHTRVDTKLCDTRLSNNSLVFSNAHGNSCLDNSSSKDLRTSLITSRNRNVLSIKNHFSRKRLRPKIRYSARHQPCQSVKHLLPPSRATETRSHDLYRHDSQRSLLCLSSPNSSKYSPRSPAISGRTATTSAADHICNVEANVIAQERTILNHH